MNVNFNVQFESSQEDFKVDLQELVLLGELVILPKEITSNGTYFAAEEEATGYNPVYVNVPDGEDIINGLIEGTLSGHYRNYRITKIKDYGLYRMSELVSVDLPNVKSIGSRGLEYCSKLVSINVPLVTTLGSYAISNTSIVSLDLPLVKSSPSQMCYSAHELQRVSLDTLTEMQNGQNFAYCYILTAVILRNNVVCKLGHTNAFQNCYHILGTVHSTHNPEGLKDGYIYVPDNLVEDYKVATNWATYASQIKPLSELEE